MHRHRHRGPGFGRHGGRWRVPNADQLIEFLEEHQRDLEQEVADTADLLRRLREEAPPAGEPAPTQV